MVDTPLTRRRGFVALPPPTCAGSNPAPATRILLRREGKGARSSVSNAPAQQQLLSLGKWAGEATVTPACVRSITLGGMLRDYRAYRRLSQRAASALLGIAPSYLCDLERGRMLNPTLSLVQRLTSVYKIPSSVWMSVKTTHG